jgi:outer membrane murein-binding lipoprotein Lpp
MRKMMFLLIVSVLLLLSGCDNQEGVIPPDNCDEELELLESAENSIDELEDNVSTLNDEIDLLLNAQNVRNDLRDSLWMELFPTATEYRKVTRDYDAHHDIADLYEVYNEAVYLGNLYHVLAVGASASEVTFIEFFLGIKEDNTFAGFRMWDENETETKADPFYLSQYGDSYLGDDIEDAFTIDDVVGSSVTNTALQSAALEIAMYHVEVYLGREYARPASLDIIESNLLLAFPSGVSFNSVYADYSYNENIYNIYEVLDASNALLGYVYYGNAEGRGGTIEFTWGIDLSDTTVFVEILNDTETWDLAYNFGIYNGAVGYWPTTSWLTNFEEVTLPDITIIGIDSVAGVTVTTTNFSDALKIIAQYHIDESVGVN